MGFSSLVRGLRVVQHLVLLVSGDRTASAECGTDRVRVRAIVETVDEYPLGTSRGEDQRPEV